MVGQNAAELKLPPSYSRLHPVFNVSLLMPYVANPAEAEVALAAPALDTEQFLVSWATTRFILGYRLMGSDLHEYLLRDEEVDGLNDEWRLLTTISPNLDPFLQTFHRLSPFLRPGPSPAVWNQRASLQV